MSTVGTYAADLWDKFQELMAKMVRAKASIKELQNFMKTQMELEQKMAQFYTKQTFTTKDMGEFENPIKSILDFCKTMGAQHQQTYNQCNQQLAKELMDIRKLLSKSIKAAIKQEAKLSSDFKSAVKAMHTAKEKEVSEKKNFEQAQARLETSNTAEMPPKQVQKLQNSVHQAEKSAENAEKNYKAAVAKQKVVRNDYYQKLALLMASLEQLDRKRIKIVQQILDKYSLLHEASWQATEKGVEKMKSVFLLIDEEREIQNFVKANKSGQQPPPPEEFVPYMVSVPDQLKGNAPSGSRSISLGQAPAASDSFRIVPIDSAASKKTAGAGEILKVVRATYEYIPEDSENELALHEGDLIEVLEMDDEAGWWMGRIKSSNETGTIGKKGFFPSNFCGDLTADEPEVPATSTGSTSCIAVVRALYPFSSTEPGELNFNEGDSISVYRKGDDGWWEGEAHGKRGVFPSNYTDAPDAPTA